MSRELFEELASRFSNTVSPEQLLADLANQVRLANVRALLGSPMVTPFDVFQSYRDEKERVSAKLVEIPVERFLSKVPEPSASEIQAFYDQYKDVLPDPSRDTPGFKVPRQIQVEILSIDGRALEESIRNSLTDAELRTAYENQKSQFEVPSELPKDLFAGKPELTPPVIQSFEEARPFLTRSLAEEKAQNQILDTFTQIKVEEIDPFTDKYLEALDLREEDERNGQKPSVELPSPTDLKGIADRLKLNHEITPMLSREQAESYGLISGAEVGLTRLSGGRKFAEEFFDSKTGLYEAVELTDILGTRFLARKIKDVPPYVPKLEDVRSQVELAWKLEKARPLAEKAAEQLAAEIRKQKGEIKEPNPEGYRVNIIPPVSRLQPNYIPNPFTAPGATVETPIPEVPNAGEAFRDALFGLREGEVAVAPNQPKTAWYVLGFQRREPASFASLYAPNGDEYLFKRRAIDHAAQELDEEWMGWLRQQAGLKPGWVPPDEATAEADGGSSSDRQS
jgi:peptidyl-prolyl cis-trans isomerase D